MPFSLSEAGEAARDAAAVPFPQAASAGLANGQLRANLLLATTTIRAKRAHVVAEVPDWEELRDAGAAIKDAALHRLDAVLLDLEAAVVGAGGVVHWARDAAEANRIVVELVRATGAEEVVKVKSLATDEIRLNGALEAAGIRPIETDLAELIVQLAGERASHLLVPAIHKNRTEIRDLLRTALDLPELSDEPAELTAAARLYLREAFLRAPVAISGANFAVAETGTICVVESEGNGRMCTTLPETLITVMGIEKVVPEWRDLGVFLQLLPRSSTGERMNPYTSLWSGVRADDGPRAFHLVLLDNGRTRALADDVGRPVLRCIRCSACVNVCPVYRRTGGHAYHTVYAGPIGAILQPQLSGERGPAGSLPFASTLCGACADVCPVKIDIPRILVHERVQTVRAEGQGLEGITLRRLGRILSDRRRYERAQKLARFVQRPALRDGHLRWFPGLLAGWGMSRDLPGVPVQTFREWWEAREPRGPLGRPLLPPPAGENLPVSPGEPPSPAYEPRDRPVSEARDEVLARIRSALGNVEPVVAPRAYRHAGSLETRDVVARFVERVEDYGARVIRSSDPARAVVEVLPGQVVVAPDFPAALRPPDVDLVKDDGLSARELDELDAALTTCAVACAETGSIALDGGPGQGRRAITLVPDLHVCIVRAADIVETVPELIDRLAPSAREGRPIVIVSGPSATSDIELDRVEGVHGPRRLIVVLWEL